MQSLEDLRQRSRMVVLGLVAEAAGAPSDGQHQQHAHQDAGDPASHEQTANGDLADGAVDDQAHARRNGGDDQAGQAVDGGRPAAVVAQTIHLRSEDAALHRGVRNSRAGNAAHQGGHQAGDLTDVAVHMAGAGVTAKPEQRSFCSAQNPASFGVKLAYGAIFAGNSSKEKA